MTKQNDKNANTSPSADATKAIADPRLKPVIKLIETQLLPVKEVLADFAKAMLDNTIILENRIKSFEKYSPRTLEDTPNEPQEPNETPSFIPRSARVKLDLNHSKALANDTAINGLKRELEECKKEFTTKVTKIFQTCAEIELKYCKDERIKTFLAFTLKITEALIIFERIERPMNTTLNTLQFCIRTIITFLRKIRLNVPPPDVSNFFLDYLKSDELNVRQILIKNFTPSEDAFNINVERTESELEFQDIISDKLCELILPITVELHSNIEKENKIKKAAAILTAKFKKTATIDATEATAIAVGNTSTENISLEQHINKLIIEAVKKHTSNIQKQQKNIPGSKSPQPSLPQNNQQGKTNNRTPKKQEQNKGNKKRKQQQQQSGQQRNKKVRPTESENQNPNPPEISKTPSNYKRTTNNNKRKNQKPSRNATDPQGGKKKGGRIGKGRRNKN